MDKSKPIIISLGGSLVVPNGGIDKKFLTTFNAFVRKKIASGWRFFIVVGGGATARHYIEWAKTIAGTLTDWDLDWLGIHTTRLNAHLIRTIFRDVAYPRVIHNYSKKITNLDKPLVIASGWKPGCSTDYDAVVLAKIYKAKIVINMSNIISVYDKDPNRFPDAKPLHQLSWSQLEKIVGSKWKPGINLPFDPVATKLAKKLGLTVYIIGKDIDNLDDILHRRDFVGTIIQS